MATNQQLETAALWLRCNDGDKGEMEACLATAEFLRAEIRRRQVAALARSLAKQTGLSYRDILRSEALRKAIEELPR